MILGGCGIQDGWMALHPVEVKASFPAAKDAYLTDVIRDGVSTNPDSIGVERVDATPPPSTHAQTLNPTSHANNRHICEVSPSCNN